MGVEYWTMQYLYSGCGLNLWRRISLYISINGPQTYRKLSLARWGWVVYLYNHVIAWVCVFTRTSYTLISIVVSLVPLVLFHFNIYLFLLRKKKGGEECWYQKHVNVPVAYHSNNHGSFQLGWF